MARQESALTGLARLGFTQLRSGRRAARRTGPEPTSSCRCCPPAPIPTRRCGCSSSFASTPHRTPTPLLADPRRRPRGWSRRARRVEGARRVLPPTPGRTGSARSTARRCLPDCRRVPRRPARRRRRRCATEVAVSSPQRIRYRRHLARIAAWDLEQPDQLAAVDSVGIALADLAGATLDAALSIARGAVRGFPKRRSRATRLAIIGMGKAGARELNYVSDVDVIFVRRPSGALDQRPGRGDRARAGDRDDPRHPRPRQRAGAVGGRRESAAGGQGRRARAHARVPPARTTSGGPRGGSSRRC